MSLLVGEKCYISVNHKLNTMKNIKDITISIFAIIGFVAIVSGFTNNYNQGEVGTYQVAITNSEESTRIKEIIIDTRTGQVISRNSILSRDYKRK